jgi:proton glutamate symport protein
LKTLSFIVLAALIAGILAGAGVRAAENETLTSAAGVVEAFGGLWLNALRMTVVPLVVALLITGVASVADMSKTGGLVARAILLFSGLILFAAVFGILAVEGLLALWPVAPEDARKFLEGVGAGVAKIEEAPSFAAWLQGLAPANPIRAAAEDAILPLVTFALFFGFAATRLEPALRDAIVNFFRAVSEAMIVVVRWILLAGPFGVFALALGVGLRAGLGAAGTLAHYVIIVTACTAASVVLAWLIGVMFSRQPITRFTAALAPVWAVSAATQSSLASLPVMLDACLRNLNIPARVADVTLPLAVAIFRFTSPVANLAVCFFVAHLYGIEPTLLQIAGAVVVAFAVSVGSVGLPGQVSFVASIGPICLALGVPIEVLGVLLAVEVIPDIFRTLGNTTADVGATAILARGEKEAPALAKGAGKTA